MTEPGGNGSRDEPAHEEAPSDEPAHEEGPSDEPSHEEASSDEPAHDAPAEWDVHAAADATLGGYFREHNRPPGFEGIDGEPYTVSLEVERTPDLTAPHEGYLVFPRWASTGLGVVGHVETPTLCKGRSRDAVLLELGRIPLLRVKMLLDEAIARERRADPPPPSDPTPPRGPGD